MKAPAALTVDALDRLVPLHAAMFLDIDGTLVDLADTPGAVRLDPAVSEAVGRLHVRMDGALALVSGRTLVEVDRLLAPLVAPAAGQHGFERRDAAGRVHRHARPDGPFDAIKQALVDFAANAPGVLLEDKGLTLAAHYRLAPQAEASLRETVQALVERTGAALRLQPGKMVFEIKPSGRDKGTAIGEFMLEAPFAGRVPVFIGDDATDEHGFAVVNQLGGVSVKVGPEPTCARWRVASGEVVRRYLVESRGC